MRSVPGRKCWECGWWGPGVELSCMQAPSGDVLASMVRWQEFPFICIGCLGTVVAEWPGNIAAELAKRAATAEKCR
jgi:hypothetical protein